MIIKSNNKKVSIAAVISEDLFFSFRYETNIVKLYKSNIDEAIKYNKVDLLLVDSYRGSQILSKQDKFINEKDLLIIIKLFRNAGIPTVFWQIEYKSLDNTNLILEFDQIIVAKKDMCAMYRNFNVEYIPLGFQPKDYNITKYNRENKYRALLLDSLISIELCKDVENRYKDLDVDLMLTFRELNDLLKINKKYFIEKFSKLKYVCHENSVREFCGNYSYIILNNMDNIDGYTDKLLFEFLACGAIVLNKKLDIEVNNIQIVGSNLLDRIDKTDDYSHLSQENTHFHDKYLVSAFRGLMTNHTIGKSIKSILDKARVPVKSINRNISIITCTNKEKFIKNIFENYERQKMTNIELIIVLNKNSLQIDRWKSYSTNYHNVKIYQLDENISLGYCLNYAIEQTKFDYIAKFDDDDYYGENYLVDSIHAFDYTNADVIGKRASYVHFEDEDILAIDVPDLENCYIDSVRGGTILVKKKVFDSVKFQDVSNGEDYLFFKNCKEREFRIYATNRFNYLYRRHQNEQLNTWKISTKEYLKRCKVVEGYDTYLDEITI